MLLYHESGVAYTTDWNWVSNGEFPIISFGKFVFNDRFYISRDGRKLEEGVDYIRVLRSKDVSMKFGVEIFGGVILLDKGDMVLDIYAVESCPLDEKLPPSTRNPGAVNVYSTTNPLDGSYQDVVNMIDELERLIPFINGVTLPIYVFMSLGVYHPAINELPKFSMKFLPLEMSYFGDEEAKIYRSSARSDFLGGIDSLPLDAEYLEYNSDPYPYIKGLPRVGVFPIGTLPLGISYKNQ